MAITGICKKSRGRYEDEIRSKDLEKVKNRKKDVQNDNELLEIENEIKIAEKGIEVAEKAISDGSQKLELHLAMRHINTDKIRSDHALIKMGLERKKKLEDDISDLKKKKKLKLN